MELTEKQEKFLEFVKEQHGTQVRKYTDEPYWTHPYAVATLVNKYISEEEQYCIEIALGHDLLEDTSCTVDSLKIKLKEIGYSVDSSNQIVSGILDLTDHFTKESYPNYNRKKRKLLEVVRLTMIPPTSQTVKYADLIENISSIVEHDKSFAVTYLEEKKEIIKHIRNGNFDLYMRVIKVYLDNLEILENDGWV
jgi:(p)ppGpp synthase/HD superfamily hydrolase